MDGFRKFWKACRRGALPRIININLLINRPLASLIVRSVYKTNIRPNHLTMLAFFVSIGGSLYYLKGSRASIAVAGILIYIGTVFDGADGMLARAKNLRSRFGAYLDLFLDRLTDFVVFGAMAFGYFRQSKRTGFLIFSLLGIALYFLEVSLFYSIKARRGNRAIGESGDERGSVYFGILVLSVLNRLDILITILVLIVILIFPFRIVSFACKSSSDRPGRMGECSY